MVLVQKIFQEKPRILSRNPTNAKNLVKKPKKIQEMPRNPGKHENKREKVRYYWMIMHENA